MSLVPVPDDIAEKADEVGLRILRDIQRGACMFVTKSGYPCTGRSNAYDGMMCPAHYRRLFGTRDQRGLPPRVKPKRRYFGRRGRRRRRTSKSSKSSSPPPSTPPAPPPPSPVLTLPPSPPRPPAPRPPRPEFDSIERLSIYRVKYNEPRDTFYEGEMNEEQQRHGYGVFAGPSYTYSGNWLRDKKAGKGKENCPDGTSFEGIFKDDHRVRGTLRTKEYTYRGSFNADKFDGNGCIMFFDSLATPYVNARYDGDFCCGRLEGTGRLILERADGGKVTLTGRFANDVLQSGKRSLYDKNGTCLETYKGECFVDNLLEGKGEYIKRKGDHFISYESDHFSRGVLQQGACTITSVVGNVVSRYAGDVVREVDGKIKPHGKGCFIKRDEMSGVVLCRAEGTWRSGALCTSEPATDHGVTKFAF